MKILRRLFQKKPKIQKVDLTKRFDLIGRTGQGSMSKVWRARDTISGKTVALKVLDKQKTRRFEARFAGLNKPTEGEIAVELRHPHIARTFEYGWTLQGEQFLVMEFVDGIGLSFLIDMQNQRMKSYRLDYAIQLGEAIAYLHENGWIHRDICPRNVLLSQENQVKLIDFGLVVPDTEPFHKPGNRTGTANYMAPELIKRQRTDRRIDIFSFAVTCFEMYTKRLPWDSVESFEAVLQHINQPPADIRTLAPDIDEETAEIIMRGLARNPDDRFPSINAMLQELRQCQSRLAEKSAPDGT